VINIKFSIGIIDINVIVINILVVIVKVCWKTSSKTECS